MFFIGGGSETVARVRGRACWLWAGLALVEIGCGGATGDVDGGATIAPDGSGGSNTTSEPKAWGCDTPAPAADPCTAVPTGAVVACSQGEEGEPSQAGYLDVTLPGGSHVYTCATAWTDDTRGGGYWFSDPDAFMSDPQSCCGGVPTPVATPPTEAPVVGGLSALHGPREVKPQESAQPGAGPLRQNPFAVIVRDRDGAAAYASALASWQAWSTDGSPHPGNDGTGQYYFVGLGVNFVLLETPDRRPMLVIGPEVSTTADGKSPLGHPTLGACPIGGGAPLALMGGEIVGTTIDNHSGRFNHDSTATPDTLDEVAKLFNCYGITVTATRFDPPTP